MKKALTLMLLLFGMVAVANTGNNEEEKLLEAKKKAAYYEIKADLLQGTITIEQAQKRWKKELKKINEEAN